MALIGFLLVAGTIWLLVNVAAFLFVGDTAFGVAAFSGAAVFVSFGGSVLIWKRLAARKEKRIQQSLLKKVYIAAQEELSALCAQELRQSGWNARVQGRDQDVDVMAEKNGVRVVLQCKLYAGPVGNKAAAGTARGIVVANNRSRIGTRDAPIIVPKREQGVSGSVPSLGWSFDRAQWDALLKRDPQLCVVADKLRPLGEKWVDKFAASYLAMRDRNHLPAIVSGIIAEARKEFEQGETARQRQVR